MNSIWDKYDICIRSCLLNYNNTWNTLHPKHHMQMTCSMVASPLMNSIKATYDRHNTMFNGQSLRTSMEREVVPIMHHRKERKKVECEGSVKTKAVMATNSNRVGGPRWPTLPPTHPRRLDNILNQGIYVDQFTQPQSHALRISPSVFVSTPSPPSLVIECPKAAKNALGCSEKATTCGRVRLSNTSALSEAKSPFPTMTSL